MKEAITYKAPNRRYEKPHVGRMYGDWTVIKLHIGKHGGALTADVRCSCGKEKTIRVETLVQGLSKRCSLCARRLSGAKLKIFKGTKSERIRRKLMAAVYDAVYRCTDPEHPSFNGYGGRGIAVHPEWLANKVAFYEYLLKLEGHDDEKKSLDRIDNEGGYVPGNLRFSTREAQMRNTRCNSLIHYNGEALCAVDFWKKYAPKYQRACSVQHKIKAGLTPEQIISDQANCRGPRCK